MGRLALEGDARDGRAEAAHPRGRRRRRDVEPDDLREGALDRESGTTRSSVPSWSARTTRSRCSSHSRSRTSSARATSSDPSGSGPRASTGSSRIEVDPDLAYEREATFEQAKLLHGARRPTESLREDPGDGSGRRRHRGLDRRRSCDQRHAHLLARAPRRGRRGVRARARAARRGGWRSDARRVGRELLRLARRHRGRPPPRGDRPRGPAGAARDRTMRSWPTSTTSRSSPARAGTHSRPRARGLNAASGPPPPRRTRRIATSSTSRS